GGALARRRNHFYSETLALAYSAMLHQMRRDPRQVLESAEAVVALCDRYGFAYYGDWGQALVGGGGGPPCPPEGGRTPGGRISCPPSPRRTASRATAIARTPFSIQPSP